MTRFVDVDVRPILRAGGEPFDKIMEAVNALQPGEGLRLFATFKPTPLLHVLGAKGFEHEARALDGGDWEVLFSPSTAQRPDAATDTLAGGDDTPWPEPRQHMDNRDLDPPEPMVRILVVTEKMAPGDVLSALLCREPIFLFPELAKRGHAWRGGFEPDGVTYKVLIRVGAGREPAK
ncbi:DUF2249 domain-containing protein [Vineibacter terrae]|uniref:DUF2249 domain-containing protein n=1 Tax=Vineibacter terrae TaxID=2586908 RepID=A0A5C8PJ42_9HYPH|nr:DUF2249 domain-containing protein [Vineibacter terrae]TXL73409.1 DUF2249 domain-containing protein [Vineibacter terrae]